MPLVSLLEWGCAPFHEPHEHLPTYKWTDGRTALAILSQHALAVRTVSATAFLTLTRPDGQSVRLDGAIAMSRDRKSVRLRAWKFNQAVFDLTVRPTGVWIELPRDQDRRRKVLPATLSASQLAQAVSQFGSDPIQGSDVRLVDTGGPQFETRTVLPQGQTTVARIDRSTLTVREYRLIDAAGRTRFTLSLGQYHDFNGVIWPTRLVAQSDQGRIDVQLRDAEFNRTLPPRAFVPPHGAEKMP